VPRGKPAPIKDIYLAARIVGEVRQIDTDALEKYLNGCIGFNYVKECRAVVDFAKSLRDQQPEKQNAN